jgi:predicted RNA-binding Zn ribbon-like protein
MTKQMDVPPTAALVRDFVNTYEPQVAGEELSSPDKLRAWFIERRLTSSDVHLDGSDLATAITVREGLRAVLLGHAGHTTDTTAVSALNDALAELPVRVSFSTAGYRLVDASSTPIGQALGQLADAIRQCSEDGAWPRLKVCARDTCRWAFYDSSRNQVRRWCSMAGCGNQIKMQRAYAARRNRGRPQSDRPAESVSDQRSDTAT